MEKIKNEIVKYITYEENGIENPFLQVTQKGKEGDFCFRFLKLHADQNFCMHYTRHQNRGHFVYFRDGKPFYTDIKQTVPLTELQKGENIRYLVMTKDTMKRKPLENIKEFQTLLKIKGEEYSGSLIPLIIYLNPNITKERVEELAQPIQFANDVDYVPSVLVITYKYHKNFMKFGVTMY